MIRTYKNHLDSYDFYSYHQIFWSITIYNHLNIILIHDYVYNSVMKEPRGCAVDVQFHLKRDSGGEPTDEPRHKVGESSSRSDPGGQGPRPGRPGRPGPGPKGSRDLGKHMGNIWETHRKRDMLSQNVNYPDPYPEATGRSIWSIMIHTKMQVNQTDSYVRITAGWSIPALLKLVEMGSCLKAFLRLGPLGCGCCGWGGCSSEALQRSGQRIAPGVTRVTILEFESFSKVPQMGVCLAMGVPQ